jgi:hypothetical protein
MTTIPITAFIRRNSDGVVREHKDSLPAEDGSANAYIWEDGNYGCDCNRAIFFGDFQDGEERKCTNWLYSVNLRNDDTGEWILREFELP